MVAEKRTITIEAECPFCGKVTDVEVPIDGYIKWEHGELIQNALPMLSAQERELVKTGICQECWDKMFK